MRTKEYFLDQGDCIITDGGSKYTLLENANNNANSNIFHVKAFDEQEKKEVFIKYFENSEGFGLVNLKRESKFRFYYPFIEHIIGGFDAHTESGLKIFCVIGEYVNGKNLSAYRECREQEFQAGKITWSEFENEIFAQILQFLYGINYYMNYTRPSYLHRDLKPQNIMITEKGITVIIDFDYAHISASTETMQGRRSLGLSPGYTDPFTIRSKLSDRKSDLYSAGRVMYYWLNGKDYYTRDELDSEAWWRTKLGTEMERRRFLPVFQDARYSGLISIMSKMVSRQYEDIRNVLTDMKKFLIGYYGNSVENYQTSLQLSRLPVLAERLESERTFRVHVLYEVQKPGAIKRGSSLVQYEMRKIEINKKLLMMIYNLSGTIYYIPFLPDEQMNRLRKGDDFEIHDQDVFCCEEGDVKFFIR